MEKYIAMSVEQAIKITNKNAIVLVAINDLENMMDINGFSKKTFIECEQMIKEAETIISICDNFIKSLKCYTVQQKDFPELHLKGKEGIILLR